MYGACEYDANDAKCLNFSHVNYFNFIIIRMSKYSTEYFQNMSASIQMLNFQL